ncbi:MAG TPA: GGDEF domain-containing protein [Chloroflexota bacterium]|nr:GGDEF domain-containing protein [Chloroflexota bacterium]
MEQETGGEERARRESRVMAGLAALSDDEHEYGELVETILRLVQCVVSCPLLVLSLRESDTAGHHRLTAGSTDGAWEREASRFLEEALTRHLDTGSAPNGAPLQRGEVLRLTGPGAWFLGFAARTRSGRMGVLTLGAPEPLAITAEEEQLMVRLAIQSLLILDHALLAQQLEQLEVLDPLTGVANQRRLLEVLDYEVQRHRYTGSWLALLIVDVEGLRAINRTYGRRYGNHILQQVGRIMREAVRPIDLVARCGLDEFAVVLPEMDAEEAQAVAERLRERFISVEFAGGEVRLGIGVTHANPYEALTGEGLLRRGEGALYEAKRTQRGWSALLGR